MCHATKTDFNELWSFNPLKRLTCQFVIGHGTATRPSLFLFVFCLFFSLSLSFLICSYSWSGESPSQRYITEPRLHYRSLSLFIKLEWNLLKERHFLLSSFIVFLLDSILPTSLSLSWLFTAWLDSFSVVELTTGTLRKSFWLTLIYCYVGSQMPMPEDSFEVLPFRILSVQKKK